MNPALDGSMAVHDECDILAAACIHPSILACLPLLLLLPS